MLKDDFYTILKQEEGSRFLIRLRADHPIYNGHFPGQPVVPGVCLLQIALELATAQSGTHWRLHQSRQMKFARPVVPGQTPELWFVLDLKAGEGEEMQLRVQAEYEGQTFFKLVGQLAPDA